MQQCVLLTASVPRQPLTRQILLHGTSSGLQVYHLHRARTILERVVALALLEKCQGGVPPKPLSRRRTCGSESLDAPRQRARAGTDSRSNSRGSLWPLSHCGPSRRLDPKDLQRVGAPLARATTLSTKALHFSVSVTWVTAYSLGGRRSCCRTRSGGKAFAHVVRGPRCAQRGSDQEASGER